MGADYASLNKLLFACIFSGAIFGFVCDVIRAFRMLFPRGRLMIFFGDILFCLFCTCVMILCFYNFSYGHMRMFGFLASGLTFALWELTIGKLTMRIVNRVRAFLSPIVKKTAEKLLFAIAFFRRRGYTVYICVKTKRLASKGFKLYKGGRKREIPQN